MSSLVCGLLKVRSYSMCVDSSLLKVRVKHVTWPSSVTSTVASSTWSAAKTQYPSHDSRNGWAAVLLWPKQTHKSHDFPFTSSLHWLLFPISVRQIPPSPAGDNINQIMDSLHSRLWPGEKKPNFYFLHYRKCYHHEIIKDAHLTNMLLCCWNIKEDQCM